MDEKRLFSDGVHCISNDDYHSSSGVSRSSLMAFKRSPFHYWHRYINGMHDSSDLQTQAMVVGNLIHTMVLEPNKFDDDYVVRPPMDRRTNAGKLAFNQFTAILAGRIAVTQEQVDEAEAIANVVRDNEMAQLLLDNCKVEQSIYFTHKHTGMQCKVRPDAWNGSVVIDLKTTADASFRAFQSSAFKYGYFLQAGMIHQALESINIKMDKFVFLAVEKESPYALGIYLLDDEALDWGVNQFDFLMQSYSTCMEKNSWPGYGLQSLTLPAYANYVVETEYEHD